MATSIDDELKCGICLELFQDPRSLPCLHTFCRECIQRSLNESDHSLKCPLCRAKHVLSHEGAGLLPVDHYALQELPFKRLQQQREDNGGQQDCKSCGKQAPVVAWCEDCDAMICQPCLALHEKIVKWRGHHVVKKTDESRRESTASLEKQDVNFKCLEHNDQNLKYVCNPCSELVCPECLLGAHRDHKYSMVEEARHSFKTKIKELSSLVENKKEEFSEYLEKAGKAEHKALEYSELMKTKVNEVFDGIVASVEAQRNDALQSVSQEVKEIWSQKEMVEVSLAQLDSFTRFAGHTNECATNVSYVAMATQGIKLMERLKDTHGDQSTLDQKMVGIVLLKCVKDPLDVLLNELFVLGQVSLVFSPAPNSTIECPSSGIVRLSFLVSLRVGGRPVISKTLRERCNFIASVHVELAMTGSVDDHDTSRPCSLDSNAEAFKFNAVDSFICKSLHPEEVSWTICPKVKCSSKYQTLAVLCKLSGDVVTETVVALYTF